MGKRLQVASGRLQLGGRGWFRFWNYFFSGKRMGRRLQVASGRLQVGGGRSDSLFFRLVL